MHICGGAHIEDVPWDRGVHGESINGSIKVNSS